VRLLFWSEASRNQWDWGDSLRREPQAASHGARGAWRRGIQGGIYPGWDRFGRVKTHALVDGLYTTGTGGNPNWPPLAELDYTYDRSSNRLTRTDARPGASWTDRDFRYEYDGLDRLAQADRGAQGGSWSHAVGGQQWALDMLGNWDSISNDSNGSGTYTTSSPDEQQERTHNFANEIEDIGVIPFAYDKAGNMTEQGLPATATKYYTHDAWNRLTEVKIDAAVLGQYEYNALHWRGVKRSRTPGAGSLDEMRLMYYSANWQLLEERIDRSWTSGFTEDERAQTFWGKRYIDDAVARRRDRDNNGTYDNNFFYVTDAQFSTVAMVSASNARVVERTTYDSYGKARHHFGGDVTGDGAATAAGDDAALQATIAQPSGKSIGGAYYKAEQDLNRDGQISSADRTTLAALTGGADQAALASGLVSFTTTGSGGSTVHGPDNPIAWDGYIYNVETGQYHVRFRWYDPVLGRWLERDPVEFVSGPNWYENCFGDPVSWVDPFGLIPRKNWWHKLLEQTGHATDTFTLNPWELGRRIDRLVRAREMAYDFQREFQTPGEQNAARHCMWQALLTYELGRGKAESIGNNHEIGEEETADSWIDQQNNIVGRGIGDNARDKYGNDTICAYSFIAQQCRDRVKDGTLIVYKKDPRVPSNLLPSRNPGTGDTSDSDSGDSSDGSDGSPDSFDQSLRDSSDSVEESCSCGGSSSP